MRPVSWLIPLLAAVVLAVGCTSSSTSPPAVVNPTPPPPPPPIKEAPLPVRANLRAELAAGYYERGQMDVALQELAEAIRKYQEYMTSKDLLRRRRAENWETRLVEMLRDTLLERARSMLSTEDLARLAAEIAEHKRDPYSVVEEIVGKV